MLTNHSRTVNVIIMAAIAFGVIVVVDMVVFPILEAWAAGCFIGSRGFNSSQARCFHP
jgi:hypothetical protein